MDFLAPPTGGGGGHGPFPHGKGLGMGGLLLCPKPKQCAGFPAHRLVDPPASPPRSRRGRSLGERGGTTWRTSCPLTPLGGAQAKPQRPRLCLETAPLRLPCHKAQRLARRTSRLEHLSGRATSARYDGVHNRSQE